MFNYLPCLFTLQTGLLLQIAGAALIGVGIFVLVDLSPEHGGNLIMVFSNINRDLSGPGIQKAGVLMIVSGLLIILYGVSTSVVICRKTYRLMWLVGLI